MDYREGEGNGGGGGDGDYGHAPTTGSDGPRFAAGHYATSRAAGHRDRDRPSPRRRSHSPARARKSAPSSRHASPSRGTSSFRNNNPPHLHSHHVDDDRYASPAPVASTSKATPFSARSSSLPFDAAAGSASASRRPFTAAGAAPGRRSPSPPSAQGWNHHRPQSQFSPSKDRDRDRDRNRDRWRSDPRRERGGGGGWSRTLASNSGAGLDTFSERERERERDSAARRPPPPPPPSQRSWEPPVPRGNGWGGSFSSRETQRDSAESPTTTSTTSTTTTTVAAKPFQIPYLSKSRGMKRRRGSVPPDDEDDHHDRDQDDYYHRGHADGYARSRGQSTPRRDTGPADRWAVGPDRRRSRSLGQGGGGGSTSSRRNSPDAAAVADRRRPERDDRWADGTARDGKTLFADSGTSGGYSSASASNRFALPPSETPSRPPTLLERISRPPASTSKRGRTASPPPRPPPPLLNSSVLPYGSSERTPSESRYAPRRTAHAGDLPAPPSRTASMRREGDRYESASAAPTTSRSETPPLPPPPPPPHPASSAPARLRRAETSASASASVHAASRASYNDGDDDDDEMEEGELHEEGEIVEEQEKTATVLLPPSVVEEKPTATLIMKKEEEEQEEEGVISQPVRSGGSTTPPLPGTTPDSRQPANRSPSSEVPVVAGAASKGVDPVAAPAPASTSETPPPQFQPEDKVPPPPSASGEVVSKAAATAVSSLAPVAPDTQKGSTDPTPTWMDADVAVLSKSPLRDDEAAEQEETLVQAEAQRAVKSPSPATASPPAHASSPGAAASIISPCLAKAAAQETRVGEDALAPASLPAAAIPALSVSVESPTPKGEPPPVAAASSTEPTPGEAAGRATKKAIPATSPRNVVAAEPTTATTAQLVTTLEPVVPDTVSLDPLPVDADVAATDVALQAEETTPADQPLPEALRTIAQAVSTAVHVADEVKEEDTVMREADVSDAVEQSANAPIALPPRPTDELSRHSPTTPPQALAETTIAETEPPVDKSAAAPEASPEEEARELTMEERRQKLIGDRVILPFADRTALINTSWSSFEERHSRLSEALLESFSDRDERRKKRIIQLRQEYKTFNGEWKAHCRRLDEIRDRVHRRATAGNPQTLTAPQTPSIDSAGMPFYPEPITPGPSLTGGRSNRRGTGASVGTFGYSDTVRSEAEFLEILASLETADLRDPDVRAARTAAVVPDMVIDPSERREVLELAFEDERYRVEDPIATYGINAPLEMWTEQEVETFCKRYALYPKQFGKIAQDLPGKTTSQCVLFYYRMKNTIDFRSLSDRRGRDGRRKKSKKRPEGGKGSALLSNLNKKPRPALAAPREDDMDDDDEEEPSAPASPRAEAAADKMSVDDVSQAERKEAAESRATHGLIAEAAPQADPPRRFKLTNGTPRAPLHDLPSEGMMEAAEVLGALSALPAGSTAGADSAARSAFGQELNKGSSHGRSGAGRARKARVDVDTVPTEEALAASPYAAAPEVETHASPNERGKPKRKTTTSSYWTLAERSEYQRLLNVYGPDWRKIAAGLGNKTWVQCRNWYQNQAKKNNLVDIVNSSDLDNAPRAAEGLEQATGTINSLVRAGLLDATPATILPALPSAQSQAVDAAKAGMHLRDMLNDDARAPEREAPVRDDWFGAESADTGSVTTEDDAPLPRRSFSGGHEARFEIPRPSSAPQYTDAVPRMVGGVVPYRPSPMVPSLSSLSSASAGGRLDGISRLPPMRSEPWSRASVPAFPAYAVSPAGSGSPATPIANVEPYRRYSAAGASADYFGVKPYERYAHSAEPNQRADSIPPLPPFSSLSGHNSPRLPASFGAAPSPPNGLVRPPSHWTPQS